MDEDLIIGQFGLILTQMRYARRALEDVERSTARYTGAGFAAALQAGPRFGAPPLLDGALMVYVVNINDLAAGQSGMGSLFGNLLGGLGELIGSIGGGFLGGIVGGAAMPYNLAQLARIVEALPPVLDLIYKLINRPDKKKDEPPFDYAALTGLVRALTPLMQPLANLVRALGENLPRLEDPIARLYQLFKQGGAAGSAAPSAPPTDWVRFIEALTPLTKGLTLLVPILLGAFASLVVHLVDVQRAITDLLTWALRMVFLLRGAVLVVLYDTVAAAARVGAATLGILATAAQEIMSALFTAIERVLALVMDLLEKVSKGISDTLNGIVRWLRTTLFDTLSQLGSLPIFAAIVNSLNAGSALISQLSGSPPPPPIAPLAASPAEVKVSSTPEIDTSKALAPAGEFAKLGFAYSEAAAKTFADINAAIGKLKGGLGEIEKRNLALEAGVGKPGDASPLGKALTSVEARSNELGEALKKANVPEAAEGPSTGLEGIARAYETWLARGAMNTLLGQITTHFRAAPIGPDAAKTIPGRIVLEAQSAGPPRPTVEIDEVIIELEPPPATSAPKEEAGPYGSKPRMTPDEFAELMTEYLHDQSQRGARSPLVPHCR